MEQQSLRILFGKYMDRQCSASEIKELIGLIQQADAEDILTEPMETLWEELKQDPGQYAVDWEQIYKNVMNAENKSAKIFTIQKFSVLNIQKFWWVAASIVMVVGTGAFLLFNKNPKGQMAIGKESKIKTDITPPVSSHAIITLAWCEKIILVSAQN